VSEWETIGVDRPESKREVWSDEQWQLYVARIPEILRPKNLEAIPEWMLYHPPAFPRRFDTHFFFAAMPDGQEAVHDQVETTESIWIRPEEALTAYQEGRFPLVFATIHQLQALSELGSIPMVLQRFASQPLPTIQPRVIEYRGQLVIITPDQPGVGPNEQA
jgi:hypothetical protein